MSVHSFRSFVGIMSFGDVLSRRLLNFGFGRVSLGQEVCVKAAVGLWQTEEQEKTICVNEDYKSLIFRDKHDTETKEYHFTFDGVFNFNMGQDKVFSELIQSMLNTVTSGYNVSILLYGSRSCSTQFLHGEDGNQFGLVYQLLEQVFQGVHSMSNEEFLITAAFMQACITGSYGK
ncbi:kinesin heavy chain-like [Rana temporaria]|uniref:kinesin heavy chain-like n=1 Tax=Rana temporaria TaxID=8407 RepID=UPI001AAD9A7A|nr:kinesin heavy chain-like [Rana temporaria]